MTQDLADIAREALEKHKWGDTTSYLVFALEALPKLAEGYLTAVALNNAHAKHVREVLQPEYDAMKDQLATVTKQRDAMREALKEIAEDSSDHSGPCDSYGVCHACISGAQARKALGVLND